MILEMFNALIIDELGEGNMKSTVINRKTIVGFSLGAAIGFVSVVVFNFDIFNLISPW